MIPDLIISLLSLPFSFFFFVLTERIFALHQFRVGKKISFMGFMYQTFIDEIESLRRELTAATLFMYLVQVSIVFFLSHDPHAIFLIYLTAIGLVIAVLNDGEERPLARIANDGVEVRYFLAVTMILVSLIAVFSASKTTSISLMGWQWTHLFFVIPFGVAGMILFGEHPFRGPSPRNGWIKSFRFYVWSMIAAELFMGGGEVGIDLHAKAAGMYMVFRLFGNYLQTFYSRDLVRVCVVYLFPISGVLWMVTELVGVLRNF